MQSTGTNIGVVTSPIDLYLDLMIRTLTDVIYEQDGDVMLDGTAFHRPQREDGRDWPVRAHTMIGIKRLQNIRSCVENILKNDIQGDFIETGVWRGGAAIFMRAVLAAYDRSDRRVWLADSFEGLPPPSPAEFPADENDRHHEVSILSVALESVKSNFQKYNLLDDQVVFLPGWFRDTLPECKIGPISLLRLDGDMYESTHISLEALYPKLSRGGYCIIDDYGAVPGCKIAVEDFRKAHGLSEELITIDWAGVYWQKVTEV